MSLEITYAIGIAAFLVIFFALRSDQKEHGFLRLILIGFFFYFLILLGKSAIDSEDHCIQFISNSTRSGNTTHFEELYNYDYKCTDTTDSTATVFYENTLRVFWLFIIYMVIWIIAKTLDGYGKLPSLFQRLMGKKK